MDSELIKPKKIYDNKKYMDTYFQKHKDDKIICSECGKVYSYFNKSHHQKSVYHNKITEFLKSKNE
jgi:uncharacterized OB-fold protein